MKVLVLTVYIKKLLSILNLCLMHRCLSSYRAMKLKESYLTG